MSATDVAAPDEGVAVDWPYSFEVLPLDHLFIDDAYQRPLSRFVKRIVDHFEPALVGAIIVSERGENSYAVIDGQTRVEAMRILGHQRIFALVYRGLNRAEEASLFARFQSERKNISALERFRAALVAEEPQARQVAEIVDRTGFVIERTAQGNGIHAVKALEDVVKRDGPELLERELRIIGRAWKHKPQGGTTNELLRGLAYFLEREPKVDDEKLIRRLSVLDPDVLHTRAAQLRQGRGMGGKSSSYMAEVIRTEYRRRRPTKVQPEAMAA